MRIAWREAALITEDYGKARLEGPWLDAKVPLSAALGRPGNGGDGETLPSMITRAADQNQGGSSRACKRSAPFAGFQLRRTPLAEDPLLSTDRAR